MIKNVRHKETGESVSEWIPMVVHELETDAESLLSIISDGRDGFGFEGAELDAYVGLAIGALLENGGLPVIGGGGTDYYWIQQTQYGTGQKQIIENIISEWKAAGTDPDLGGLWFARPMSGDPNFVKLA